MGKIRVVLADDHSLVREGFRSLLHEDASIDVVGEAENGQDAVLVVKKKLPDVVVLDISMPVLNGVQATVQIHKFNPKIRVLILSMHRDEEYVREVFQAGASGYILKQTTGTDLIKAIKEVNRGNAYLSPAIATTMVSDYREIVAGRKSGGKQAGLTNRETQVLQLIAEGNSNKEIAERLFISVKTVETHRLKIMNLLHIHDVAGLTRYAIAKRIIEAG
ncbi:MAG TPA: response regulator transcription factor [Bacteroidota bacterium]|jgi:DNA-binding NarL/FixJ family response regulator